MSSVPFIPYSCQSISEEDIAEVARVLRSDYLTQGPEIAAFEMALCGESSASFAVVVSSGTAALHIAVAALGIGPKHRVWTTPVTFVASANCALYCGAEIDFVDIEPDTALISISALEEKLRQAERTGTLPDLVIPVHFAGKTCDMAAVHELARRYGFRVLEDASHAIGARYPGGAAVGSARDTTATIFSFHAVKAIATGEGGAVMTHDPIMAEKCGMLRTHGITRNAEAFVGSCREAYCYEQQLLGFNYRLTDFQAALGRSQLTRLSGFISRRRELAARYAERLRGLPCFVPSPDPLSAWHLFVILAGSERRSPMGRDELFRTLRAQQIGANVHYLAVHLHPYYRKLGFHEGMFPAAEQFAATALSLPLHPRLAEADQDRIIAALQNALT